MKKLLITLFLAVTFLIQGISQTTNFTFQEFQIITNTITESVCPVMVDSETRFDKILALQDANGTFIAQYNYTLVNTAKSDYSALQIETILRIKEAELLKELKQNDGMKIIRDSNIIISYVYYDKYKDVFMIIKLTPEKYNARSI